MSRLSLIASLPDEARVYVPEVGEVTMGEVRAATEQGPALDEEREATIAMWEDIATRNLLRPECQPGVRPSDIKAYHALRFTSDRTPPRST